MKMSCRKIGFVGFALILAGATMAQAKQKPPQNIISMAAARKTATDSTPGKVQGEELEYEGGKWVYSFDLRSAEDSKIHEIQIDALSGKVVSTKIESAREELKEKAEDEANEKN